jgi:hypothetical protein
MTRTIIKAVVIGVLFGTAAFFVPRLLLGLFILGLIIRLFHGCCGYHHGRKMDRLLFMADMVRKMSDEDYEAFKTKMGGRCCNHGCCSGHCCGGSHHKHNCCESKKEETKS